MLDVIFGNSNVQQFLKPTNQPTKKPTNQPTNQPTNKPTNKQTNKQENKKQPNNKPTKQKQTKKQTNKTNHQPTNATEEKLAVPQPVEKFPALYGTRRFITAFTRACQQSLS